MIPPSCLGRRSDLDDRLFSLSSRVSMPNSLGSFVEGGGTNFNFERLVMPPVLLLLPIMLLMSLVVTIMYQILN